MKAFIRANKFPIALTIVLAICLVATFTPAINPPQCPISYSQEQIDASGCVVGANIGLGLWVLFILLPIGLITLSIWVARLVRWISSRNRAPKQPTSHQP